MPYRDRNKQRASTRKHQNAKRAELYKLKESTPCADCGRLYPYYVMQFDHKVNKGFVISSRSASYGSELFNNEILKCDLVCANCHAIRTHNRNKGA